MELFDKNGFFQWFEDTFDTNGLSRDIADNTIQYALNKHTSLDDIPYFLCDILGIEFEEACGFTADEALTRNGQLAKAEFLRNM